MHSIFQIPISKNAKCVDKTSFPRSSHNALVHEFVFIVIISFGLLVKPSIYFKKFYSELHSKVSGDVERSISTRSSTCSSKSMTTILNAYCLKSHDYQRGDRLYMWLLPWAESILSNRWHY